MLTLVGFTEVLKTIYTLSYPFIQSSSPPYQKLKNALKEHLSQINPEVTRSKEIEPEFIISGDRLTSLLQIMDIEKYNKNMNSPHFINEKALHRVRKGFNYLNKNDSQLGDTFRVVVDTVAVTTAVTTPGSASSHKAVGMIWVQPDNNWSDKDIVESLVHEMTHTLLYLDEQCYGHFHKDVALNDEKAWVPSAIRNTRRPVYGVVHSIIVATELLSLRKRLGFNEDDISIHGRSSELFKKTNYALNTLKQQQLSWELLTPRMKSLINRSDEILTPDLLSNIST